MGTGGERTPPARHVVAVGSGKGGVGKSTVSVNLALALHERGARVGILDADVYAPNIPLMLNLTRYAPAESWSLWDNPRVRRRRIEPVERHGIQVMSSGFIAGEQQPLAWSAPLVSMLLRQCLFQVDWGDLEYLIVDLPPGTADLQQELIRAAGLAGAVIVLTPQDVAHLDAKRLLAQFEASGVRVLGAIENMRGLSCPNCGHAIEVFPTVRDDRSIWAAGVERLGDLPLDPATAQASERGRPIMIDQPGSVAAAAFRRIADRVAALLERPGEPDVAI
jgi:ATP-binding protein involved in chromosome partitioning